MQKNLLLTAATFAIGSLFHTAAVAQFYVQSRNGYAFETAVERVAGLADATLDGVVDNGKTIITPTTQLYENVYGTGGAGFNAGVEFGYMFNKYIGVELGVHYFMSETTRPEYVADDLGGGLTVEATFLAHSNQVRVAPSVIVRGGDGFAPYGRFGLMVPVYGNVQVDNEVLFISPVSTQHLEQHIILDGAFSLGYNTAFGLTIPIEKNFSAYAEAELLTIGIKAAKSEIVSAKSTRTEPNGALLGIDYDNNVNVYRYDREVIYEDAFTEKSNVRYDPNNPATSGYTYDETKPRNELSRITSYTSLGFNVGVRYSFAKKAPIVRGEPKF
jgi:hypothetical protein